MTANREEDSGLIVTPLSEIVEQRISWLWPAVIPYGKLTLFVGHPGEGKSLATLDIAARLSRGHPMPDGTPTDPSDVLLIFCEDGVADTVTPRLRMAGANLKRIHEVKPDTTDDYSNSVFDLTENLTGLKLEIERLQAKLVVVDPVTAYLGHGINEWRDSDVRRVLEPLGAVAEETGSAMLGIMHLNKNTKNNAISRVTGSTAFVGVARSVYLFGSVADQDQQLNDRQKVCAPFKMNLSKGAPSRNYSVLDSEDGIPHIRWENETRLTADDLLAPPLIRPPDRKRDAAYALISETLAGNATKDSLEMLALGLEHGISEKTMNRAKGDMGVISVKIEDETGGHWGWKLPEGRQNGRPNGE